MANNFRFTRTTMDKLSVKDALISEDCSTLTYVSRDGNDVEIKISDILQPFKNCEVDFVVSLKTDESLDY